MTLQQLANKCLLQLAEQPETADHQVILAPHGRDHLQPLGMVYVNISNTLFVLEAVR